MNISIDVYRSRIGTFAVSNQKNVKQLTSINYSKTSGPKRNKASCKLKLIIALLCILAHMWANEIESGRQLSNLTKTKSSKFTNYFSFYEDRSSSKVDITV